MTDTQINSAISLNRAFDYACDTINLMLKSNGKAASEHMDTLREQLSSDQFWQVCHQIHALRHSIANDAKIVDDMVMEETRL